MRVRRLKIWPSYTCLVSRLIGTFTSTEAGSQLLPIYSTITPEVMKMPNQSNNPMQPERLGTVPHCLARTRVGTACQSLAVSGGETMPDARRD